MSFEESEESKLRLTEKRRSGGMGRPETMYLKMRAWCSSSCHWLAVKGNLFLPLIFQRESIAGERAKLLSDFREVRAEKE